MRILLGMLILLFFISCKRSNYICECESTNSKFQNVYQNATESEAEEYCEAAEELYSPGHVNLECHAFEID